MASGFLSTLNIWAVLVAGIAFWLTGALWFSVIFGNMWATDLEKHGVIIKEPTSAELRTKLILNLVYNIITALGVAYIVYATGSGTVISALKLGLASGIGFSFCSIGISALWESRSNKLLLIDAGHPILGIIICFIILSLWK